MIPLLLIPLITVFPLNMEIYSEKEVVRLGEKTKYSFKISETREDVEFKGINLESADVHVFEKEIKKNKITLQLGVYETGQVKVPTRIYYIQDGVEKETSMPPFIVNVATETLKDMEIREIKPVMGILNPLWPAAAIFLIALLSFLYFKSKNKKEGIGDKEKLTPRQEALIYLRNLKDKNYPQKEMYKEYYEGISFCLRRYIEEKYGIKALESTGLELKRALKHRFSSGFLKEISGLLSECDLIKFAPAGRKPENIEAVWQKAQRLIEDEL